jgi:metal-responsive CopG/Arc/MetJ family transcriptional regulator
MGEQQSKQKITVMLPSPLVNRLKQAAKRHQRSFNGELIWAVQQYLEQIAKEEQDEQK